MCDYAEAYILVDGTIRATNAVNATRLALKNCAPFTKCNLEINDEHVDTPENLDIVMPMYNLIEYSVIIKIHQQRFININKMNHQKLMLLVT